MASAPQDDGDRNFELFRDCLSAVLVERLSQPPSPATTRRKAPRRRRKSRRGGDGPRASSRAGPTPSPPPCASHVQGLPGEHDHDHDHDHHVVVGSGNNVGSVEEGEEAPEPPDQRRGQGDPPAATTTTNTSASTPPETDTNDAEELSEFVDYIAAAVFASLPQHLRSLTRGGTTDDPSQPQHELPLTPASVAALLPTGVDPAVADSLAAYGAVALPSEDEDKDADADTATDLSSWLAPILTAYVETLTAPPPPRVSRGEATACEICGRDWINLTYHHLIPRFVHAKAVKRGWHREGDLQNVAWLCGACHRAVHRFAGHEDLARRYYTVELLLAQGEIADFARWVGRLRWKKR